MAHRERTSSRAHGGERYAGALVLLLLIQTLAAVAQPVPILKTPRPVLDGRVSEDEWALALHIELGLGADAWLGWWQGSLYVGLRGPSMLIGSLLVESEGTVRVLHASAALGTGVYQRDGSSWTLVQGFAWQCRMTGFSDAAAAQRDAFLEQYGWLATISRLGPVEEMEYRLDETLAASRLLVLAMTLSDGYPILAWPVSPEDAERHRGIITGPLPDGTSFDLASWLNLASQPASGP